jgi:mRNA interferase HigB
MRIIALSRLRPFWEKHPNAAAPLQSWYAIASDAQWASPADVKADYRNASFLAGNRIVFNIKGNEYRLIVAAHYNRGLLYVRFVGTHAQYDKVDATTI